LAFAQVLILPLDVSNSRGDGSGFRVDILWQIVFILVAIYVFFLAPFSLFYYEAEDEETTVPRDDKKDRVRRCVMR
jgi:LMBR1 domain-containing protein 1